MPHTCPLQTPTRTRPAVPPRSSAQPAGLIKASLVYATGQLHRVVHVWVFNAAGQVLLRRRAAGLDLFPDMWDVSASACVKPGAAQCARQGVRGRTVTIMVSESTSMQEEPMMLGQMCSAALHAPSQVRYPPPAWRMGEGVLLRASKCMHASWWPR